MNTENNKIIAEFLNWTLVSYPTHMKSPFHGRSVWWSPGKTKSFCCEQEKEHFHDSWEWLMGVIIKISIIATEDGEDTFYPRTFGMLTDDGEFMFRFNRHQLFKANTLIEAAYKACVDFIKWYNQQNSNNGEISQNIIK